ncbi:MAG: DsrE family protein [Myxococcota bacterium]
MTKIVVGITNPGSSPADNGRTVHALKLAGALKAKGADVIVHFHGEGVKWIDRFVNRNDDSHPFVKNYGPAFDAVRASARACNMCCKRFDQSEAVQAASLPIDGEGRDHTDVARWVVDGYQLVNY